MQLLLEGILAFCLIPALAFVPFLTTTRTLPSHHIDDGSWQHIQTLDSNTVPGFRINSKRQTAICYMARAINTMKQKRSPKFQTMIGRLEEYYKTHGHSLITEKDDDTELYKWTRQLRYNYVHQIRNTTTAVGRKYRRKLSDEKLKQLESLEFVWETKRKKKASKHDSWDSMIRRLNQFHEEHGHTKVTDEDDAKLFAWCKYIRYSYGHQIFDPDSPTRKRSRPRLAKAKLNQLLEIGFDWGMTTRKVRRWDLMFPRLQSYHETNKHCNVTPTEDLELYHWVNRMRYNYQHQALNIVTTARRPRLAKAKLATLNEMGFIWESSSTPDSPEERWQNHYQELCNFRKKNGHCYVPSTENKPLHVFCNRQREEFRRYKLGNATSMTEARIELLSEIQFEWIKPHDRTWKERRAELEDYWKRFGDSHVPQDYNASFQLGQWCMNQRSFYRMNKNGDQTGLTSERTHELEKLDFQWNYRRLRWYAMFQRLKRYQEEHGHLEISTKDFDNGDLRQWVNEQRFYHRAGRTTRVTPERKELLDSIPDFSWDRKRATGPSKQEWDQLFVAIKEKGIAPGGKIKQHWFEGANRFDQEVKTQYNDDELLALWNEETEDEDEEDEDGDEFYEDEETALFLRA